VMAASGCPVRRAVLGATGRERTGRQQRTKLGCGIRDGGRSRGGRWQVILASGAQVRVCNGLGAIH
jgi:hypothetical protein